MAHKSYCSLLLLVTEELRGGETIISGRKIRSPENVHMRGEKIDKELRTIDSTCRLIVSTSYDRHFFINRVGKEITSFIIVDLSGKQGVLDRGSFTYSVPETVHA